MRKKIHFSYFSLKSHQVWQHKKTSFLVKKKEKNTVSIVLKFSVYMYSVSRIQ